MIAKNIVMKKNNLFSGALILSIGGVFAKIFSAIYRIVLTRILGGEGIGLYQLVFPLYSLCVVIATAGLPMAISKVISRYKNNQSQIVKKCLLTTSLIALALGFVLVAVSKPLATLQGSTEIWVCYVVLAPTIILISASSVLRGYFQGVGYFTPSTVSNIIEQFAKLTFGLTMCVVLVKISLFASIVGAMVAIAISELFSLTTLLIYLKKNPPTNNETHEELPVKEIFKDVWPITLTNVILPITGFVDSLLVVNLLAINFSRQMSIFMYGVESGAVGSLISLPTIFSFAIASVLLPSLTANGHIYNKTHKLALGLKIVLIITLPCVICFLLIPDKLITILYANRLSGYGVEGLNLAYRLLAISGLGVVFLAINQLYSSCLQAIDKRFTTIRNLIIAVVVKYVIQLTFMPSAMINIYALAIGNTACYVTAMVLNHIEIGLSFPLKFDYMFMCKLLLCNVVMLVTLVAVFMICDGAICSLLGLMLVGLIYVGSLLMLKIFNKKDIAMLKYGTIKR